MGVSTTWLPDDKHEDIKSAPENTPVEEKQSVLFAVSMHFVVPVRGKNWFAM